MGLSVCQDGYLNQKVVASGGGRNGQEKGHKGRFWDFINVLYLVFGDS